MITTVVGPDNQPLPRFAQAGVAIARGVAPGITYTYFNMTDPVVGGYGTDRVALRRAIGMAYNTDEDINVLRHGRRTCHAQRPACDRCALARMCPSRMLVR